MSSNIKKHWVFRAHVVDRAGALTSISSAFSNEGINIETVVGHGTEKYVHIEGSVLITFSCSEKKRDIMARKIERLSKVIKLEEHSYDSKKLRKSVLIRSNRPLKPVDVVGEDAFLTHELVNSDQESWTYFLAGAPSELDPVLSKLELDGVVSDIIYSVIGL
jgi:acetolactate synthase small subunit